MEEIRAHNYVLTPGRYVGAADLEEDGAPFEERFAALKEKLEEQFANVARSKPSLNKSGGLCMGVDSLIGPLPPDWD